MTNYQSVIRAELAANSGRTYREPVRYTHMSGTSNAWGEVADVYNSESYEDAEASFWGSDDDSDDEMNCIFF